MVDELSQPHVLPLQPRPIDFHLLHIRTPGHPYTSLTRVWPDGASGPGGTCRLCPTCTARHDVCAFAIRGIIPRELAPLFSLHGLREQGPLAPIDQIVPLGGRRNQGQS